MIQLRPNFYMIAGAGGNIAVQAGPDGVVVVDTGSAAKADAVLAAIRKRADRPIRYVIDTSADAVDTPEASPLFRSGTGARGVQVLVAGLKLPKLIDVASSREGVTASLIGNGAIAVHEAPVMINRYRRCLRPRTR